MGNIENASSDDDYFRVHKRALRLIGISFRENESRIYRMYSSVMVFLVVTYPLMLLPQIIRGKDNFITFVDDLLYQFCFGIVASKYLSLFVIRMKIKHIANGLQNEIFTPKANLGGTEEEALIGSWVKYLKRQTNLLVSLITAVSISGIVLTLYGGNTKNGLMPFGPLPTIPFLGSYGHTFAYLDQLVMVLAGTGAVAIGDTTYMGILSFLCAQCKIMQLRIARMVENSRNQYENSANKEVTSSSVPWKYLKCTLRDVVVHHSAIIQVVDDLEAALNIPLLVDFLICCFIVCLGLYQGFETSFFGLHFLETSTIIISILFIMSGLSFWGNELTTNGADIARSCVEVDFIGTDIRFQKGLALILLRSQKPLAITFGKFTNVSLIALIGILKFSGSVLTLLRNIKVEDA